MAGGQGGRLNLGARQQARIGLEQRLQPGLSAILDALAHRRGRWQRGQAQGARKGRIAAHVLGRIELGNALTQERTIGDGDIAVGQSGLGREQRVEHLRQLSVLAQQLADGNQTAASGQGRA